MRKLWLTPEINGLDFSENEVRCAILQDQPLLLTLYTKGICNAKCPSCYITSNDEFYSEMNIDDYIDIIREARTLNIKSIKFSGAGEPLLVPEILEILKECNAQGIVPIVYTNGSLFGDNDLCRQIHGVDSLQLIDELYNIGASLVYKCNSMNPQIQDKLLGVENMSTMTYKGLLNLIYYGYNESKRLALQTIITPQNYYEVENLYRFSRKNRITPYFETVLKKGSAGEHDELYLDDSKIKNIFLKLLNIDKNEFGIEWFPVPSYVNFQCTELGYSFLIDNFGYIKLCPGIWKSVGNIRETSLKKIWESEYMVKFRARVNQPMKGKCATCSHKATGNCGYGCRAYAYLNTGDLYGEYSECWW